jgi:hypothetical protein
MKKIAKSTSEHIVEAPEELSLDYFESNPKIYSARVLGNLAGNSLFRFLFGKRSKNPTPETCCLLRLSCPRLTKK